MRNYRVKIFVLIMILVFVLVGCGNSSENPATSDSDTLLERIKILEEENAMLRKELERIGVEAPAPNQAATQNQNLADQAPAEASDFIYVSNGTEVQINGYQGKGGYVVIPDTIDGLPVTRIANSAFQNANNITGLSLPSHLQYIGGNAFNYLNNLTGVLSLPPTMKEVGSHAFQVTNLTGLVIQSDCVLELNSFANITTLDFIFVKDGCSPVIKRVAFGYNNSLTTAIFPSSMTEIEDDNFEASNRMVIYTQPGSFAEDYGKRNFIKVDTDSFNEINNTYESEYIEENGDDLDVKDESTAKGTDEGAALEEGTANSVTKEEVLNIIIEDAIPDIITKISNTQNHSWEYDPASESLRYAFELQGINASAFLYANHSQIDEKIPSLNANLKDLFATAGYPNTSVESFVCSIDNTLLLIYNDKECIYCYTGDNASGRDFSPSKGFSKKLTASVTAPTATPKPTASPATSKSNNSISSSSSSGNNYTYSGGASTTFHSKDRSQDAWVCAVMYVEDNLKSPTTAKFCKYPEGTVMRVGEDEYVIHGYVDAQNSFGATVRQTWTVSLFLTEKGFKDPYLEWG